VVFVGLDISQAVRYSLGMEDRDMKNRTFRLPKPLPDSEQPIEGEWFSCGACGETGSTVHDAVNYGSEERPSWYHRDCVATGAK
jgi:hypothetical protein